MLGIHDMGGMHNFGPIDPVDDKVFHHDWEGLTFALEKICGHYGVWHGADEVRHAIEKIGHGTYLTSTYYEHWLHAWEPLLFEKGIVGEDELRARQQDIRDGRPLPGEFPESTPAEIDELSQALRRMISQGFKAARAIDDAATFSIGDKVRVLPKPVATHTRCPRYVWDREPQSGARSLSPSRRRGCPATPFSSGPIPCPSSCPSSPATTQTRW